MSRLVVVSNRLPGLKQPPAGGEPEIPAGGLASGVWGTLRSRGGSLWFGWNGRESGGGGFEEREVAGVRLVGMPLSRTEVRRYYQGFCNSLLWPLFHCLPERVQLDANDEQMARRVQQGFARELAPRLQPGDLLWVHDYHLLHVGDELRRLGWEGPIGFFLHIPFPPHDLLGILPHLTSTLRAMMAYDVVGFHVLQSRDNYAYACQRQLGARWDGRLLRDGARRQEVDVFPIGIDPSAFVPPQGEATPAAPAARRRPAERILLGVDRLDYTKGIPERIQGLREYLERRPHERGRVTLVQIGAPSRTRVRSYVQQKRRIENLVGKVNSELGLPDWVPVRYLYRSFPRSQLARLYREADVGLVTPLRDGMNLVAKEFVASQASDDPGVLVLSRFAGAAEELSEAVLVNPYSPTDVARGIERALAMPLEERRLRQARLFAKVTQNTADEWGRSFVEALETVREGRRPGGRVVAPLAPSPAL